MLNTGYIFFYIVLSLDETLAKTLQEEYKKSTSSNSNSVSIVM
jgi:hypothetical protein